MKWKIRTEFRTALYVMVVVWVLISRVCSRQL